MERSHLLFESIFKLPATDIDVVDYLFKVTERYPFFTAAHFFLLQKTDVSNNLYAARAAKTAILFNNPFWLNYQLVEKYSTDVTGGKEPFSESSTYFSASKSAEAGSLLESLAPPVLNKVIIETAQPVIVTEENVDLNENKASVPNNNPVAVFNSTNVFAEEENTDPNKLGKENQTESQQESIEDSLPFHASIEMSISNNIDAPLPPTVPQINKNNATEEYNEEEEPELEDESEIEPMNIRLNFKQDIETTEETISFEPLHTSDYFASLGIKLNQDGQPVDKFGRQLKSFTEWLKTMKNIHSDQLHASTEQTDTIIQKMAEKSNTEGDVLTEAMAEVLMHQGKLRKAIELYQKLSLLNPAKSAYFAAKIEQIAR